MAESTTRQELIEHFGSAVEDNEECMNESLSILKIYSLPPSELFYKWEAYILSRPPAVQSSIKYTVENARELRREIQRELQSGKGLGNKDAGHGHPVVGGGTPKVGMRKGLGGDIGGFLDNLHTPTRPSPLHTPAPKPRPPPPTSSGPKLTTPSGAFSTPMKTIPTPSPIASGSGSGSRFAVTPAGRGVGSSPIMSFKSPTGLPLTGSPATPFAHRTTPFQVLETLNPHLASAPGIPLGFGGRRRVGLSMGGEGPGVGEWGYRYMFEKISERSEALDNMIDEFAVEFATAYDLQEFGDPSLISEGEVYVVGRIISLPTDSGKPTDSSLMIESSRALGDGKRTPLRFAPGVKVRGGSPGVKGFGVFAGCLVGLKGKNGGGGNFVVQEVLLPQPQDMPTSPATEVLNHQHETLNGQPISVIIAAGPYTLDSDLLYEPLDALMESARNDRPDALILLGPFVDSAHPLIKVGEVDQTPSEIFRTQVSSRISLFLESCPATSVIMIPSVRDMISRHVAFPQAMLEKSPELGLHKRVRLLPNPCSFFINEVLFSLSTVDVLFHLRKEEYFKRAEEAEPDMSMDIDGKSKGMGLKDSMAELCRHILGQNSFYPLFPTPEEFAAEVNLDVTHKKLLKIHDKSPDVLILPSKLKHFAKIVDSVVALNPSFLSKSSTAGTFCKLSIHPQSRSEVQAAIQEGTPIEHKVFDRMKVEVVRV